MQICSQLSRRSGATAPDADYADPLGSMGSARALIRESAFIRVLIRQAPPVAQCLEFSEPVQTFFRSFYVPARDVHPSGGWAKPLPEFERICHTGDQQSE